MKTDERIAQLESKVADLAATVNVLVEASRKAPGAPTVLDVQRDEREKWSGVHARVAKENAVRAAAEPARSNAFLELNADSQLAIFKGLGHEQLEFARALSDEAYAALAEALPEGLRADLAWKLAALPPCVAVTMIVPPGTHSNEARTNRGFSISQGERQTFSRDEWNHMLATDDDLKRLVEGTPGGPLRLAAPPRLHVETCTQAESRQIAQMAWHKAKGPLPPRASL